MWPCTVRLTELPLPFHPLVPQVDWDLASVGAPGVTVNIALKGQVNYNFKSGCWGMKLEASLGVSFGFDVMGAAVGEAHPSFKALCSTQFSSVDAQLWTCDGCQSDADHIQRRASDSPKRRPQLCLE